MQDVAIMTTCITSQREDCFQKHYFSLFHQHDRIGESDDPLDVILICLLGNNYRIDFV